MFVNICQYLANAGDLPKIPQHYYSLTSIIVDNGSEFANELMTELSLLLGLKKVHVTPYNSKANGKVEVAHKTTQTILRAYIEEFKDDWDLLLPLVEFAMNTSTSKSTGFTPFYLFYGRHPILEEFH